jgi:hypothetical protein
MNQKAEDIQTVPLSERIKKAGNGTLSEHELHAVHKRALSGLNPQKTKAKVLKYRCHACGFTCEHEEDLIAHFESLPDPDALASIAEEDEEDADSVSENSSVADESEQTVDSAKVRVERVEPATETFRFRPKLRRLHFEIDSDEASDVDSEPEQEADPQQQPEPEAQQQPEPEAQQQPEPEAQQQPEPEAQQELEAEPEQPLSPTAQARAAIKRLQDRDAQNKKAATDRKLRADEIQQQQLVDSLHAIIAREYKLRKQKDQKHQQEAGDRLDRLGKKNTQTLSEREWQTHQEEIQEAQIQNMATPFLEQLIDEFLSSRRRPWWLGRDDYDNSDALLSETGRGPRDSKSRAIKKEQQRERQRDRKGGNKYQGRWWMNNDHEDGPTP